MFDFCSLSVLSLLIFKWIPKILLVLNVNLDSLFSFGIILFVSLPRPVILWYLFCLLLLVCGLDEIHSFLKRFCFLCQFFLYKY